MHAMSRGTLLVIVPLAIFLVAALYTSYHMWVSIGGGTGMNGHGVAALIIGGIGTVVLGGGLMALMFFSSRRGYDDAADLKNKPFKDR